jgi:hypothetical protein
MQLLQVATRKGMDNSKDGEEEPYEIVYAYLPEKIKWLFTKDRRLLVINSKHMVPD